MTGTISASTLGPKRAQENFVRMMTRVASLYCMGGSSSIFGYEAQELAMSVAYVLGIPATTAEDAVRMLDVEDPIELWRDGLTALDGRMDAALGVWLEIVSDNVFTKTKSNAPIDANLTTLELPVVSSLFQSREGHSYRGESGGIAQITP